MYRRVYTYPVVPGYLVGLVLLVPSAALMVACAVCPCVWVWRAWRRDPAVCGRVDNSVKRVRQNVSVEFTIPESVVGYVIGRHGASIRQLEEESGARVHFKDQQGSKDKVRTAIVTFHIYGPANFLP